MGEPGFFSAGTWVGRVPAWILVIRTLGTPDLRWVLLRGFLRASFPYSMSPLDGAAAFLDSGGAVGAFDGMVARALSFGGMALHRPWNGLSGAKEHGRLAHAKGEWNRRVGWTLSGPH